MSKRKLMQDGKAPVITTNSGRIIDVIRPNYRDITMRDIIHGLSGCGRFVNQCDETINVGQHTCYVTRLVSDYGMTAEQQAFLHDASEAFICDIPKWLKNHESMAFYREIEERWWKAIARAFDVPRTMHWSVGEADRLMVRFEARKGFKDRWECPPNYPDPSRQERDAIWACFERPWRIWSRKRTKDIMWDEAKRLRLL